MDGMFCMRMNCPSAVALYENTNILQHSAKSHSRDGELHTCILQVL